MKRASIFKHLALIAIAATALPDRASATGIAWGSVFNDTLLNSTASVDNPNPAETQQLDTTFSFEIGTFGGFIPTYSNISEWAANWKVFDRAFDPDSEGWNAEERFFAGFAEHNDQANSLSPDADPLDPFPQGERIYLWAYNSKDIVPTSEWALVTGPTVAGGGGSPWVMPDPADTGGSYDLRLADANEAIIGGVNGVRGDGDYSYAALPNVSNPNTITSFSLQTAVVPEPGSVLLLFSAGVVFMTRRARRLTRGPLA